MSNHDPVMAEADNPKTLVILGAVTLCSIIFIAIIIATIQYFGFAMKDEIQAKQLAPVSTQLRELRAQEQLKLSRYQWVDKSAGVVRIPLDRATELTLRDWSKRPTGLVGPGGKALEAAPEATP